VGELYYLQVLLAVALLPVAKHLSSPELLLTYDSH
jgi:hypothetical protein